MRNDEKLPIALPDAQGRNPSWSELAFDSAPVPMWVYDAETLGFLEVNQAALDEYGYSRDEFLALTVFDLRVASQHDQVLELQRDNFRGGRLGVRHRRKDGSTFEVEPMGRPVVFGGRAAGVSHLVDISARVEAEAAKAFMLAELKLANDGLEKKVAQRTAALARQEALFRTLAEHAPLVIWTVDATGANLTFANKAWYDLMGGTVADWSVRGARLEATHPDDRAEALEVWARALRTKAPFHGIRRLLGRDGRYRTMSCRGSPVFDAQGAIDFWVGVDADVTELKEAEQASLDASRSKSIFLATVSHEIRTPMNGLLGLLELLSFSGLDREQLATLTVVRESGRELLHILDDVLDFSKIEAGSLELNLVPASLSEVVQRACLIHKQPASARGLTLDAQVDPAVSPRHRFDPARLGQILNNFLNNAIKFTSKGSVRVRLDLVAHEEGLEHLSLAVEDTGLGLSPEQLARLFQPFVQASSDTSTHFGGTGLGLVICRRLAQLMGGSVAMSSEVGRGTTLTLTLALPVCAIDTVAPGVAETAASLTAMVASRRPAPTVVAAEQEGTLVLVVDDHPTNRAVLTRQLNLLGYGAESAVDGAQALLAWKTGRFGAMILDCNMPVMGGHELTRLIRAEERLCGGDRIPIIACTADALPEAIAACMDAGMDDCLVKPAGLELLGRKLAAWLPLR